MEGGGLSAQMGKVIKKKAISAKLSLAVMLVRILILIYYRSGPIKFYHGRECSDGLKGFLVIIICGECLFYYRGHGAKFHKQGVKSLLFNYRSVGLLRELAMAPGSLGILELSS